MMNNPIDWFEIYVQDMPRARAFYEKVFAVQLQRLDGAEMEMWAFPSDQQAYGAAGALVKMQGVPSGGGGTLLYFSCEDCVNEAGRIKAAGGTVVREKFSIGQWGFIALATDTESNMIGLHSMH
jgi:predicted enzyme related to lactoylglutathione lyase